MIKIESTSAATITIKGTSIQLPEVTTRLEFFAPANGTLINVGQYVYENLTAYNEGKQTISIDGFNSQAQDYNLSLNTDPVTYEEQSLLVAHQKVVGYLEGLGFVTTIIGL